MPHIIETTAFKFAELSDAAKRRAREWWVQSAYTDPCEYEHIYEDAADIAELFGLDIRQTHKTRMDGSSGYYPTIYWSGFWSQGDGACFEGSYRYKKGGLAAVKAYAPQDTDLHAIVESLQVAQRRHFYKLSATCKHRGHYSHSGCMQVEVCHEDYRDMGEDEDEVRQALRWFADWIYSRLSDEYDFQTSDEIVDEALEINEYDFTEEGEVI